MYYSTTSILPQRPGKSNNARIKFTDTLLKKMAKEKIKRNTKVAAKMVKRSVARFTTTTGTNARNSNNTNNKCILKPLPMMSSNKLFHQNTKPRKPQNAPKQKTQYETRFFLLPTEGDPQKNTPIRN